MPAKSKTKKKDKTSTTSSIRTRKKYKVDYSEIGSSGNYFSGGYEIYEYQSDLIGSKKFEEYDKMKRGSAMARATLRAVVLPLLAANWFITSKGKGKADKAQVEFVEQNLFGNVMSRSWKQTLNEILQHLAYGMYPMEKVWVRTKKWPRWRSGGDWIILKKLAPRHPMTIDKINFNNDGGLKGIRQTAYFNFGDS